MRAHQVLGSGLVALALLVAAPRPAGAVECPSCSPELAAMLNDPGMPDDQPIPVIFRMAAQLNLAEVVGERDTKEAIVPVLVPALKQLAADTQDLCLGGGCCPRPGLSTELDAVGATGKRSYWLPNALAADVPKRAVASCAGRADVAAADYDAMRERAAAGSTSATPFDSLAAINLAPAHALGTGAGTVVGIVGTGVDAAHPALAPNGLRRADDTWVWKDAVAGEPVPYDDIGEGTHLAGVAVGRPPGGGLVTSVGVAPDARWIACKAVSRSAVHVNTLKSRVYDCLQWMLHPDEPGPVDPAHVPDVVLAAIFFDDPGFCDTYLLDVIRTLRAARIVPVVPSGHDTIAGLPAAPESLSWPASYPEAFGVGASTDDAPGPSPWALLATSYRGTAGCRKPTDLVPPNLPARYGPQVAAPGVNVSSAWPGGGYRILTGDPEAVAAAHVAGAAALLRSIAPTLHPDHVRDVLQRTADGYPPGPPVAAPMHLPGRLNVGRAATLEEAVLASQVPPPSSSVTDSRVEASVSMRNTGVTTWVPGVHGLAALTPVWGETRVGQWVEPKDPTTGAPLPVVPGRTATFLWEPIVPHVPGTYGFRWQLARGDMLVNWPTDNVDVRVLGTDLAIYLGRSPSAMNAAACGVADVAFRNAGTNTWGVDGVYQLGEVDSTNWARSPSYLLEGTVPPGATGTFRVNVCAPNVEGLYDFQWRILKNGVPTGIYSANDRIRVIGQDGAALVGFFPPPSEMRAGQPAWVMITLRNSGSTIWGPGYCLKGAEAWFWGTPDVCLPPAERVFPGQEWAFRLGLVAPDGRQRQSFTYRLHNAAGVPFGDAAATTVGMPWDFQASTNWAEAPGVWGHGYWFFRYQDPVSFVWWRLGWASNRWGTGTYAGVWQTWAHPGPNFAVARFWKSPVNGTIRVSGSVSRRNSSNCGDGVTFGIYQNLTATAAWSVRIARNDWSQKPFNVTLNVAVDDSIRFLLREMGNDSCDATNLDPLVQILPPPWVGPIPAPQPVSDPWYEP
jgi:hypothetical protein